MLAAVLMQLHIREIEAFQPGDKFLGRGEDSLGSSCDKKNYKSWMCAMCQFEDGRKFEINWKADGGNKQ